MGVQLERNTCVIVVVDLAGRQVARTSFRGTAHTPPEQALPFLAAQVKGILEAAAVDRDRVLGVGLVSYGPQDRRAGLLLTPQPTDGGRLSGRPPAGRAARFACPARQRRRGGRDR